MRVSRNMSQVLILLSLKGELKEEIIRSVFYYLPSFNLTLDALERNKLVQCKVDQEDGRHYRFYRLTGAGNSAYQKLSDKKLDLLAQNHSLVNLAA